MATDSPNQHAPVIAKDLLIAAIESKSGISLNGDPEKAAAQLVAAYKVILNGLQKRQSA